MLTELRIKNVAVIAELAIEFGSGLNVLTGETGAGKSMILKAIELLSGARASNDLVRHGAQRLEVDGLFELDEKSLQALAPEYRESTAHGQLVIRRTVDPLGRSKAYINGRLAALGELQAVSQALVSITGQHQQQALLDASYQRRVLDEFGVDPLIRAQTEAAWSAHVEAKRLLEDFVKESSAKDEYFRRLEFEDEELSAAKPGAGERAALDEEVLRLSSVESLAGSANQVLEILDNDETGLLHLVRRAEGLLGTALQLDRRLQEPASLLESARIQLQEASRGLADYGASLEGDPERLEQCRERIADLARLERKYGRTLEQLVDYHRQIQAELAAYHSGAFNLEKLQQAFDDTLKQLNAAEKALSKARKAAAERLAPLVERELAQVNMQRAKFAVDISICPSGPNGIDAVQFMLAPNPGEPFKPVSRVASGGELARVLLILKSLLHEQSSTALQIFDEVDSGIGGAVAQVVGERLKALAGRSQVLLITHAPQIASLADRHFLISKRTVNERTETSVKQLSTEERVGEVARMLAGKKITSSFEGSARELLKHKSR